MKHTVQKLIVSLLILLLPLGCAMNPVSNIFGMIGIINLSEIDDNRPGNLTDRDEIVAVYHENGEAFLNAAETGSFQDLESIYGVSEVIVDDRYIDIEFGGSGFGSSTNYYGIFYSETDQLNAFQLGPSPMIELVPKDGGFSFTDSYHGGNGFYVEPLGNHYFYYETHF